MRMMLLGRRLLAHQSDKIGKVLMVRVMSVLMVLVVLLAVVGRWGCQMGVLRGQTCKSNNNGDPSPMQKTV